VIADVFAGGLAALKLDGSNPRDPAISRMLGLSDRALSGAEVSSTKVLGYPAVWRAVNLIGNGVAKTRPHIYRRLANGGKTRATEHSSYRAVSRRPNRWMRRGVFSKTLTVHKLLWGNGIAYVTRNANGTADEYMPLLPDRTGMAVMGADVQPDSPIPEGAEIMYWTKVGGETRWMLPENILHVRNLSFNGLWGFSAIDILKETFGLGLAAREFGARFFGQGAAPSGVLFMPPGMTDEVAQETFAKGIREAAQGLGRSHMLMIVEEGAKLEKWSFPPEAAQFLQTREFEIREIAAAIGCQPHKLGDPTRKSYNSLEQSNQEHLDDDLDPHLGDLEEAYEETALTEREKEEESHFVEFNRKALLRTNLAARSAHYTSGLQNGYYSINDVRRFENEDPIGPEGDVYRVQMQMVPVQRADEPVSARTVDDDTELDDEGDQSHRNQYRELALHECRRFINRVSSQAVAKAKQGDAAFLEFLDGIGSQCAEPESLSEDLKTLGAIVRNELNRFAEPPYAAAELAENVTSHIDTIRSFALTQAESLFGGAQ
jgi:HK97 family phage portal protein